MVGLMVAVVGLLGPPPNSSSASIVVFMGLNGLNCGSVSGPPIAERLARWDVDPQVEGVRPHSPGWMNDAIVRASGRWCAVKAERNGSLIRYCRSLKERTRKRKLGLLGEHQRGGVLKRMMLSRT